MHSKWALLAVLCLTLLVRGVALWVLADGLDRDPDGYLALAKGVWRFGVLGAADSSSTRPGPALAAPRPSAFRPPLYPLLLVPCVACGSGAKLCIGMVHLLGSIATVWLTWRLAARWRLSPTGQNLAAVLVAIDPILVAQTAQIMTETLAALLTVALLLLITQAAESRRAVDVAAAGAVAGLAVLCRPTFLPWVILAGPILALSAPPAFGQDSSQLYEPPRSKRGWRTRFDLRRLGVYFGAAALLLGPWAVRNWLVLGRPVVTTTHGGYTLLLGNNRLYYDHLRSSGFFSADSEPWRADELQAELHQALSAAGATDELSQDRAASRLAIEAMREQPGMFVWASLRRVTRLWGLLPQRLTDDESAARWWARHAVAGYFIFEFTLAALGLWQLGRAEWHRPWLWALLLAGVFTLAHAFYWTDLRMRAPLVPVLALAAGRGVREGRRAWLGKAIPGSGLASGK
jgi:hypothetical protein